MSAVPAEPQQLDTTPEERVRAVAGKLKTTPNGWDAHCPVKAAHNHDDQKPSLGIAIGDDGRVLLNCRSAGCTTEDICAVWGIPVAALFPDYREKRPSGVFSRTPISLKALATAKKLPEPYLRNKWEWRDGTYTTSKGVEMPCVEIPYPSLNGGHGRMRLRLGLQMGTGDYDGRFLWPLSDKTPVIAYTPDRCELARAEGYAVIVEGETDTVTLLRHNFPAIGLPGSTQASKLTAEHVAGLDRVYVVIEPDTGGPKFEAGVPARLRELNFRGRVLLIRMPKSPKDVNELYVHDQNGFEASFRQLMRDAVPYDAPAASPAPHEPEPVRETEPATERRERADRPASAPPISETPPPPRSEKPKSPPRAVVVPPYKLLADAIMSMRPVGPRLSTGFPTLDLATRGGIPFGRVIVLVGEPGASKTTCSTFFMDCWEKAGAACVYLAGDEPADGIQVRLGQLGGFSRDGMEAEDEIGEATRAGFAKASAGRGIVILDPDEDEACSTIEDAEKVLLHMAGDRPRVLFVDSLQMVYCRAAEEADNERARTDMKLAVLRRIAKRGTLVVVISEMSRAGYRSRSRSENISGLAAGKESGRIEYGAVLLMTLRPVPGEDNVIDVDVQKNRLGGKKPNLRLRLDPDRASLAEEGMPAETEQTEQRRQHNDAQLEAARQRVIATVLKHPDLTSANKVWEKAGGNRPRVIKAVGDLLEEGVLAKPGKVLMVVAAHRNTDG